MKESKYNRSDQFLRQSRHISDIAVSFPRDISRERDYERA